jgi:hypothetical protein
MRIAALMEAPGADELGLTPPPSTTSPNSAVGRR